MKFFLGVGAQKAGTTWLHRYLSGHPEVYLSKIKEMHFFDELFIPDFVGDLPRDYYLGWLRKSVDAVIKSGGRNADALVRAQDLLDRVEMRGDIRKYFDYFEARVSNHRVFGEITPTYSLLREEHFKEISKFHADTRPIFIMRDPVERYWSAMRMIQRENPDLSANQLADRNLSNEQHIRRGRYDLTIEALTNSFGKSGYLLIFYETLFRDDTIQKICDFLDISFHPADFEDRHNVSPRDAMLTKTLRQAIADRFSIVYDTVGKQVDKLPEEWLANFEDV